VKGLRAEPTRQLLGKASEVIWARSARLALLVALTILALSIPLQRVLLRILIEDAYEGGGPSWLAGILEGRSKYPLGYYMTRLDKLLAVEALIVLTAATLLAMTLWRFHTLRRVTATGWLGRARGVLDAIEPAWAVLFSLYAGLATVSVIVNAKLRNVQFDSGLVNWGRQFADGLADWHATIISGQALAPLQYRILTPYLAEGLHRAGASLTLSYDIVRWAALLLSLCILHLYLRRWFSSALSTLGVVILAGILPLTYLVQFQYLDPLELLTFVIGFYAIRERRIGLLMVTVLVGTLNKESAILLPIAWAAVTWGTLPRSQFIAAAGALLSAWLLPWLGLRAAFGNRPYYTDFIMVSDNLFRPESYALPALLFGPLWILAFRGLRRGPRFLRMSALIIPLHVAVNFAVGIPDETRLFIALAPIIIPLALLPLQEFLREAAGPQEESHEPVYRAPPVRVPSEPVTAALAERP